MTALDRSFIKAYDKGPQSSQAANAPSERPAQTVPAPHFISAAGNAKPLAFQPPAERVAATAEMHRNDGTITLRFDIPSQFMSFDHRPHVVETDAEETGEEVNRKLARSSIASILTELAGKPLASDHLAGKRDTDKSLEADATSDAEAESDAEVATNQPPAVAEKQRAPEKTTSKPQPPSQPTTPPHVRIVQQDPPAETSDSRPPESQLDFASPQTALLYGGAQIIRIDTAHVPVATQSQVMQQTPAIHDTIDVETLPSRLQTESPPTPTVEAEDQPIGEQTGSETHQVQESEAAESRADEPASDAIWTRPAFEVDQFVWPDVCQALSERAAAELTTVANEIWKRARSGKNTVAVVGNRARQGRTTLTLCLARQLAEMDLRVAVIDGNFNQPGVASALGVATQIGWDDAIANHLAVSESVIESIDDRLAILPLRSNRSRAIVETGEKSFPTVTQAVRGRFDVVLADLAACSWDRSPSWLQRASGIDWALVMGDCDAQADERIAELSRKLSAADVKPIGIVEHELLA